MLMMAGDGELEIKNYQYKENLSSPEEILAEINETSQYMKNYIKILNERIKNLNMMLAEEELRFKKLEGDLTTKDKTIMTLQTELENLRKFKNSIVSGEDKSYVLGDFQKIHNSCNKMHNKIEDVKNELTDTVFSSSRAKFTSTNPEDYINTIMELNEKSYQNCDLMIQEI